MFACPECYRPVRVRPGAPEGRCTSCLHAAQLSTALRRAVRLGLGGEELQILAEMKRLGLLPRDDHEENRKTGASRGTGATSTNKKQKGGRFGTKTKQAA